MSTAEDIRESIAMLANGSPACIRVADAMNLWLGAGDAVTLETALGVSESWRGGMHRQHRDDLVRALAVRHFPLLRGRRLASAIVAAVANYEAGEFRLHVRMGARPDGLRGDLFDLLTCGAPMLRVSAIRSLLAFFSASEKPRGRVCSAKHGERQC